MNPLIHMALFFGAVMIFSISDKEFITRVTGALMFYIGSYLTVKVYLWSKKE